jgi:hypothetical protein
MHVYDVDNLGATYLSPNLIFHARTKQIETDYYFFERALLANPSTSSLSPIKIKSQMVLSKKKNL